MTTMTAPQPSFIEMEINDIIGGKALNIKIQMIPLKGPLTLEKAREAIPRLLKEHDAVGLDKSSAEIVFAKTYPHLEGLPMIADNHVFFRDQDQIDERIVESADAYLPVYFRFPRLEGAYIAAVKEAA